MQWKKLKRVIKNKKYMNKKENEIKGFSNNN